MSQLEIVHKGRANQISWQLQENGQAKQDAWWAQITRVVLSLGESVIDSQTADPHVLSWEAGALDLRLGLVDLPEGRHVPELVVYTVSDPQGIEWGGLPVLMVRD